MFFDIQKASMTKRISAWILDVILLAVAVTGFGFLISVLIGYDAKYNELDAYYVKYETEYGISFHISEEELNSLSPEEAEKYSLAASMMDRDEGLQRTYALVVNLSLVILSLGMLGGYLITELAVPLILGNGQTLGKKVFGLCVMQKDQTKLKPVSLVIRTVLGKYAIETMVPALMIVMLLADMIGIAGTLVIVLILILQVVLIIATPTDSAIHDALAATVVVDAKSQKIFDDVNAKEQYRINLEKRGL
ncbi:MAG: RDD family protein [Lachnospiraceae bacterium]|nr:RDD family protein [Lachnospiraceae bacterium]